MKAKAGAPRRHRLSGGTYGEKRSNQEVDAAEAGDAPLIDLNDASIKKMIARAKKRGVVTSTSSTRPCRRTRCRPSRSRTSCPRSTTWASTSSRIDEDGEDDEEDDKDDGPAAEDEVDPLDDGGPRPAAAVKKEPTDRTDDPVRMYLREMGAVELLSREGEIAIAKRIEAGRDT